MANITNDTDGRTCYPDASHVTNAEEQQELDDDEKNISQVEMLNVVTYKFVIPILISTAVVTNLLNVLMLWKVRRQQKQQQRQAQATTYCYLMWLAITDLLASITLVPSLVHFDRMELSYGWAFYYAHFEIPIMNAMTSASVYIVVGLSVDRYIAVCHPRRYHSVNAPYLAVIRITLSLVIPVLIYIPHCFYQRVVCAQTGMGWTYQGNEVFENSKWWHPWEVAVEICHRMAPATLLVILNSCIIFSFKKVTKKRKAITKKDSLIATPREGSPEKKKNEVDARSQQERRLVNLLVAIVLTFLLTNLPAAVLALADSDGAEQGSFPHEVFRAVANCLEVLGFSLNFVLYFIFVSGMRQVLNDAFTLIQKKLCSWMVNARATRSSSNSSSGGFTGVNNKNTECVEL